MSTLTALAPALESQRARASASRMAIVTVVYLAIVLAAAIYPVVSPLSDYWNAPVMPLQQAVDVLTALVWLAVLLVSMARQPDGRLWKLIFLVMVTQRIEALEYVPNSLVWSVARVTELVGIAFLVQLLVAFPSGYLRDRFDRLVVGWAYLLVAAWTLKELVLVGDWFHVGCNPDCIRNVLVFWPNEVLYNQLRDVIASITVLTLIPLVIVAIQRHWRAAGAPARRTLLPLVVALPLWLVLGGLDILSGELDFQPGIDFFDSPTGTVFLSIAPLIFPVGLLLGILRTRWSRGRIASLVVELGRGVPVGGLRDVLARTLGDPTLQLAFAAPSGTGYVDASGQPVDLPLSDPSRMVTRLERDDELLGVLVHDPAIEAEDPGLVEAVGNAARLALENERLAAEVRAQLEEVRASRLRIVEAADAERRRVERDLHDGAQQRLVALAMRLQIAKQRSPGESELLDEATAELQTAIGEVRGLARGIHPTILTEAGLAAAADALAERTPIPVVVDVDDQRYEAHVEAAAYFVIAEALTNVARHASASEARVGVTVEDGRLVVTVADDGRGGADLAAGSGVRGLADRLAAAGGNLTLSSPRGGGTIVRADLPLRAAEDRAETTDASRVAVKDPRAGTSTGTALAAVRAVPQRPTAPQPDRRVRLVSPVMLTLTVTVLVGLVAVGVGLLNLGPKPPIFGRATTFAKPFYYEVAGDSGLKLFPGPLGMEGPSDHLHVLATRNAAFEGMSIWVVGDGLASWCSSDAPLAPRPAGRDGLLAYLRSIPRLVVAGETRMTVDGRPAMRVDLTVKDEDSACPNDGMALWRDAATPSTGQGIWIDDKGHVRLIAFDVDEATIALEIWSPDNMANWVPRAMAIVDTMQFVSRSRGEAPPGASPSEP
jgi:signal transduction histidine kinase